jgi:hypothetical protein
MSAIRTVSVAVCAAAGLMSPSLVVSADAMRATPTTVRVSVSDAGEQGSQASDDGVSVSSTGRFVAFASRAPNLVDGDTNGDSDVFVRDVVAGTTTRVSVGADGRQSNADSSHPSITPDGHLVAFQSVAWNLVPGDVNGASDVFLRDLSHGTTTLISRDQLGSQGNALSELPAISADGKSVAFDSFASNLVAGDDNGVQDVFVKRLSDGSVQLASLTWEGQQANNNSRAASISDHGTIVAFMSAASNLTSQPDVNGADDVFVRDLSAATTELVSSDPDGNYVEAESTTPSISADGGLVAFDSNGPILPPVSGFHVYRRELATGTTAIVDLQLDGQPSTAYSVFGALSSTGRFVAFISNSRMLVTGDTNGAMDVFVRDMSVGRTIRVSVSSTGQQGNRESSSSEVPAISAAGRAVAFYSTATNLVPGDTNGAQDAFLHR